MSKDEDQLIKATLSAFGPDEGVRFAQDTWAKLHQAMSAVVAQPAPVQEPESFEQWNAKQHGDPEEIGFLQALRIAYCAGQDSVTKATPPAQPAPVQEPVKPTAQEVQNAASNLALMREMWGEPNQPAAKVNDEGFIVETGLLLSPGTLLYTTPPAQPAPVQGPVAWVDVKDTHNGPYEFHGKELLPVGKHDLYTAAQRQWAGLTDEEMQALWDRYAHMEMMRAIEAKLKEKNNG